MVSFLAGTLSILATHIFMASVFAGIGFFLRRSFGLRNLKIDDCFMGFWMGFGLVIGFLIFWNFFLPIGIIPWLVVVAVGLFGIMVSSQDLRNVFQHDRWRPTWGFLLLAILAALWIGNLSSGPLSHWDSSTYHIQGVKWAKEYAIVPGIANLHGPLGFNNTSLLYSALLDVGPWEGRSNHLANGLLILVMLIQVLTAGARFLQEKGGATRIHHLFVFVLLAPVLDSALDEKVSSFVTDPSATMIFFVVITTLYRLLAARSNDPREQAYAIVCIATLLAVGVSLKMNTIVFAATGLPVALILWIQSAKPSSVILRKCFVWCMSLVLVVGVGWMLRGLVLSGYPFFPSTFGGVPVEWRVPPAHAEAEYAYIVYSGREFSWDYYPRWVKHVIARVPLDFVIPLGIAGIFIAFTLTQKFSVGSKSDTHISKRWWIAFPLLVAIGAWLSVAPDTRYVIPLAWSFAALALTEVLAKWVVTGNRLLDKKVFGMLVCLGVSPLFLTPILLAAQRGQLDNPFSVLIQHHVKIPGGDQWFQPVVGKPKVTTFKTSSGLALNVPVTGVNDWHVNRCWDAPLPCTTNPSPALTLRVEGQLQKGFKVNGSWQMQNWPYYWNSHFLPMWEKHRQEP